MPDLSGSRAVLIGSSVYNAETLRNVPQVANSLEAMRRMLISAYCGWPESSLTVISNGASAEQAINAIDDSAHEVEDGGALLIYFVGHGRRINDGRELCLAMPTTKTEPPDLLKQTSLPISAVKGVINHALRKKPRTTKILILDCCYSGTAVLESGEELPAVDAGGMFVLTASREYQFAAFDESPAGMTYFTQCLTEIVREGIPNKPAGLKLMDIRDALTPRLRALIKASGDLLQDPDIMVTDQANRFVFAHNVAVVSLPPPPPPTGDFGPTRKPKPEKPRREPSPLLTPTRRTLLTIAGTAAVTGAGAWLLTAGRDRTGTPQAASSEGGGAPTTGSPTTAATTPAATDPAATTPQTSSPVGSNAAAPSRAASGPVPTSVNPLSGSLKTQSGVIYDVAFAPHGKNLLASSCADGTVQLWTLADPSQPTPSVLLKPNQGSLSPLAFHPAGHILAAASSDGQYASIVLWDVSNSAKPSLLKTWKAHNDSVNGLAFSPDGSTLASCSADGTAILWNVTNPASPVNKIVLQSPNNRSMQSVAYSPKGDLVAGGSWDDVIYLWNPGESQPRMKLSGHTNTVFSLAFSADGQRLVSGSIDGTVRVWDMSDPTKTQSRSTVLTSDMGGAQTVAVSASGVLAAGFVDGPGTILLWNLGAPGGPAQLGQRLNPFASSVTAVAFSEDGRLLAGGSADWSMRLWQLA